MADHTITAHLRTVKGKQVNQVRRQGLVPATIYGPKTTPVNIQFPYRPLQVALMKAGGTSIIDLVVEGDKTYQVLAREVQRDILRGDILHVDFFAPDMTQKIRADVPLVLTGESVAVQAKRAILITGTNNITLELLPSQLLHQIEVDLSVLKNPGDTIHVGDIKLGEGIVIVNDTEEMIAKLVQPSAARAAEAAESEADDMPAMPEVIGRGKEEEEE
ncbi:MAG: 50S ribosomal protein L25 [Anaerolineae bacterium]|nr:50S ribosomal protein L25 [Anaerolineae bacterium]